MHCLKLPCVRSTMILLNGTNCNILYVIDNKKARHEAVMSEKILVVDDEREIADLIEVYLKNDGYTVYKYYNGTEALQCIGERELDLAILDIMLPDVDGFHICQKIREKFFYPVIMLTAKVEDSDKIMGLTLGADDYITKPFNPLEVLARVKTQLRRYTRYNVGKERDRKSVV